MGSGQTVSSAKRKARRWAIEVSSNREREDLLIRQQADFPFAINI
jgi:hypothetical protein